MPVQRIRSRPAHVLLAVVAAGAVPLGAQAQVEARAVLAGQVFLGDSAMGAGTVVLHRVSDIEQGEIDSTRVANGEFSFTLPGVPNPAMGDIYFASVEHQGVMYFGPAITQAIDLDSAYVIQAYDTLLAPAEGTDIVLEGRTLFIDAQEATWTVTDVFQLRNDLDRTIVARPGGRVWTYPLPPEAAEVITSENEISAAAATYESGSFVVRAAIPPGQRTFVVRYTLASLEVAIPTPGTTAMFDLLLREPAPALDVPGLTPAEGIQTESGATYRRYAGENIATPTVQISLGEETSPPPVQWIAVILASILAAGGILALRSRSAPRVSARERSGTREELLLQVARLDEDYQRQSSPTEAVTQEYRARRAALLQRLRERA